jgi:hypothetical protein
VNTPRPRPAWALLLAVVGVITCSAAALLRAGAALADSELPPPETPSHTGALLLVGLALLVVILASVAILHSLARSRANRRIEEEYEAQRDARLAEASRERPPDGGGDE